MSNVNHVKNCKYIKGNKSTNVKIKEFKLKQIREESFLSKESSILMLSKRSAGKSWLCRSILFYFKDIPAGMIIAPTEVMDPFYSKFVPDTYIHYEYKSKYLIKLFERQEIMMEKKKKYAEIGKVIDERAFLLMDDCLAEKKKWIKDDSIIKLMMNGRHYHIMFLLTIQEVLGIDPKLRTNFDYIFILKNTFVNEQRKIYENYAGMFKSLDMFRKTFTKITENFGSMVIVNKGNISNMSDQVMWFKAGEIDDEFIGCKQYIDNHETNYDSLWRKHKKTIMNLEELDKKNINDVDIEKEGDE